MADKNFSVKIDKARLTNLIRVTPGRATDFLDATAFEGQAYVQRSYGVSPSAPGEFPGVDTGTLKNSITVEPAGQWQRNILTQVEYAAYLEFGTERMAARPHFMPMAVYLQRQIPLMWNTFVDV